MTSSELFDRVTLDRLLHKFVLELDNSGVKGSSYVLLTSWRVKRVTLQ